LNGAEEYLLRLRITGLLNDNFVKLIFNTLQKEEKMTGIDPMYNLVNTILDNKEVVFFLGAGASMDGTQDGKPFPGFGQLMDRVVKEFGFNPKTSKERFDNFLEVIKEWEKRYELPVRLRKFLEGEPGASHHYLAALSIALHGDSNTLMYLTTNYDDLMTKAFSDLERNAERAFGTIPLQLGPYILGSEFQKMSSSINGQLREGRPVILKLFGDLNSQSPIFRQEDMVFEPEVEKQLINWMKKPMVVIGYSFSNKIINQLLYASRGVSPVFVVNPSEDIPQFIKNLDRVHHIKNDFSGFISDFSEIMYRRNPPIKAKVDKILEAIGKPPVIPGPQTAIYTPGDKEKRILILASNPKTTAQLRLGQEVRDISEGLRRSKYRDQFKIDSEWAVNPRSFRRALFDHEPHIVHFTGHGNEVGLIVEDEMGLPTRISTDALAGLFKLWSNHVECVILSACLSKPQAKAIKEHIKYVIGMNKEIKDKCAIEFVVGFYDALYAGRSYEDAFEFGRNAIETTYPDQNANSIPILL